MRTLRQVLSVFVLSLAVLLLGATPLLAKCGHLKLSVSPKQAYVYVDGVPLGWGSGLFWADPGEHTLAVYNYGFKPYTTRFTTESGKTSPLTVALEAIPGTVPGPWGRIQLKGPGGGAVFLNGNTPDFFVGNVAEFTGGKRRLLAPPGNYQLTVVDCCGGEIYSGPISVSENQATIVPLNNPGGKNAVDWPQGKGLGSLPRFNPDVTVAVAKPTSQLTSSLSQIDCGGTAQLKWSTTDAPRVEISGTGEVAASGEQAVQPKQTTPYRLTATGPGGTASSDVTVNVNSNIQGSLRVTPAEIRYRKVGGKVEEQGSASLSWSASGADTASLDPVGSVSPTGNQTVQPTPRKTDVGPVDETVTYALHSSNACGGSDTQTASLHIVGSIEGMEGSAAVTVLETKLSFNSTYFNYDRPGRTDPQGGLVPSQQVRLRDVAANFKQYLEFRPEAHLILGGHADQRGTSAYNDALTQRRADRVKSYLIEQGVPAAALETRSFGKEENLTSEEVLQLNEQNPNLTPEDRKRVARQIGTFRMANNRRVDVTLSTTGQKSLRYFPLNSDDLNVLLGGVAKPAAKGPAKRKAPVKK